jgi:hypothetical protein
MSKRQMKKAARQAQKDKATESKPEAVNQEVDGSNADSSRYPGG